MSSKAQFHIFEQGKDKIKEDHTDIISENNTAMCNVYIVSYIKASLFIKSVSILSLVEAIILTQLGKQDPLGHPNFKISRERFPRLCCPSGNKWLPHCYFGPSQLLKCCPSFPQSYQSPYVCN